jgi:hypothetical protein
MNVNESDNEYIYISHFSFDLLFVFFLECFFVLTISIVIVVVDAFNGFIRSRTFPSKHSEPMAEWMLGIYFETGGWNK